MTETADGGQMSFLSPDAAILLHLVRENLRLLGELTINHDTTAIAPRSRGKVVRGPLDLVAYLGPEMAALPQEQLRVVLLDMKNQVLGVTLVYQGGLNSLVVRLADVFREAVGRGAAAIILVHNHPSGDPTPSPEDVRMTEQAVRGGELLGIDVLDHLVVASQEHISLREKGLFRPTPPRSSPPAS